VRSLTVGERQQLEIIRLMALGVEVLILDEPTTGISSLQRQTLFKALGKLADQHKAILLVSHKLEDVEAVCNRVTVLRQGRVAGEAGQPFDTTQLLEWMFGTPPALSARPEESSGEIILNMEEVSASGGRAGLTDCTVTIRKGEMVGLAGLEGSGQDIFLRLAAGLIRPEKGTIMLGERDMTGCDYHEFRQCGAAFLPAARLEEGLIPGLTIEEHFALKTGRGVLIPWHQARERAEERIDLFRVVGTLSSMVESLSGGNQQRLLLALMPADLSLLLLEHPTRGLDVESAQEVWQKLIAYAARGAAVVFSSVELDEIIQVANRILVFYNGTVIKDTPAGDTTLEQVGRAIAGKV